MSAAPAPAPTPAAPTPAPAPAPAPVPAKSPKSLILYVFHQRTPSVEYFLNHGIEDCLDIQYIIIINNPTLTLDLKFPQNVNVINRENVGHDFGGWSAGLFSTNLENYDFFIFLNSTVIGPIYPQWTRGFTQKVRWVDIFTNMIQGDVKLAGTTIGVHDTKPHVQSMSFVTDRIGLNLLIKTGIFSQKIQQLNKRELINTKEIRMSTVVLEAGYNIDCLLSAFSGIDWRTAKEGYGLPNINPFLPGNYFGIDYHVYETLFRKVRVNDGSLKPYLN